MSVTLHGSKRQNVKTQRNQNFCVSCLYVQYNRVYSFFFLKNHIIIYVSVDHFKHFRYFEQFTLCEKRNNPDY